MLCASLMPAALAQDWGVNDGLPLVRSSWVYAEPKPTANTVGQITQGNVYQIRTVKDGWTQIDLPEGITGWTPASAIDYALAIPNEAWDNGLRRAVVLVSGLSLREAPSDSAKRLQLMPNGSHGYILEEREGKLLVQYHLRTKNGYEQYTGWINQEYTLENPAFIHLKNRTKVYAFASEYAPTVGQTQINQRLAVIGQVDDYYVVNLRSASGFIKKHEAMWSERQIIEGI